jgi:hypothetical protein
MEVGFREEGIEERSVGVSLSLSGSSVRQVPEARISKRPDWKRKAIPSSGQLFRLEKKITAILHFTGSLNDIWINRTDRIKH